MAQQSRCQGKGDAGIVTFCSLFTNAGGMKPIEGIVGLAVCHAQDHLYTSGRGIQRAIADGVPQ